MAIPNKAPFINFSLNFKMSCLNPVADLVFL